MHALNHVQALLRANATAVAIADETVTTSIGTWLQEKTRISQYIRKYLADTTENVYASLNDKDMTTVKIQFPGDKKGFKLEVYENSDIAGLTPKARGLSLMHAWQNPGADGEDDENWAVDDLLDEYYDVFDHTPDEHYDDFDHTPAPTGYLERRF